MLSNAKSRSGDLRQRALDCLPGGVNSNVRLDCSQQFFVRASGARMWDTEGKEYVDYALGQGPMLLGHGNTAVNDAVTSACARGMVFSAQHPLEVEAAEQILGALGWAERVRIGLTGSEAVQATLRIARAATSREKIVRFVGHYHGWMDNVLLPLDASEVTLGSAGQLNSALDATLLTRWNDLQAFEALLEARGDEVAAVLMEPVMLNSGSFEPGPGFLQGVRRACDERGIVLVFDEVITGFRVALGGAVERYGIVPDLATYGKAMAGGWPVAAFAGRAELMDLLSDGRVNHSGTFNGSVMASSAVVATLSILKDEPPYEGITAYGSRLMEGLGALADGLGVSLRVAGLPMAFTVSLGPGTAAAPSGSTASRAARAIALHRAFAEAGIWTTTRGLWFVSSAHDEPEYQATLERAERALAGLPLAAALEEGH
jgi:glutamate-1-semialdehyde 2,1-aminomutase